MRMRILTALLLVGCNTPTSGEHRSNDTNDWCDSIYHQNVSCPKHGEIEVPAEVLAKQEADHLAWCDMIDHRNVGCPNYSD